MKATLVTRVFNWNERRYDQELNIALTERLLFEEWGEWLEATQDVDLLDALLDTAFVAYGAIWKSKESPDVAKACTTVQYILAIEGIQPGYVIPSYIANLRNTNNMSVSTQLMIIAILAECQAELMGLTLDEVDKAFEVVCDSNDSKSVAKTASDVKANVDKGPFFIAPEPRLQEILDGREFS